MNLSVIIVTRSLDEVLLLKNNEFNLIPADEVIIVCTAKDYFSKTSSASKIKFFSFDFKGNYADLKNYAISKAKGRWILSIDSDELIERKLIESISDLISTKEYDGYWFRRRNYLNGQNYLKHGLFYPDYQLRLFRNEKEIRYKRAVHEQLNIPDQLTKKVQMDLLHFPKYPKYTKFSDLKNILPYVQIEAELFKNENVNGIFLILKGANKFIALLLGGFIRGKGFLDGWAGLRAHIIFATSIFLPFLYSGWSKLTRVYSRRD